MVSELDRGESAQRSVDELFALAFKIQESRRRSERLLVTITMTFMFAAATMTAVLMMEPPAHFTFVGPLGAMALAAALFPTWMRVRLRMRRDGRALFEVLSLLREAEAQIAVDSNWSALDRARFRIQLSRFEVGG